MLPEETVAAIFTKLLLVYGKRFSDAYAGQDLGTVKRHWQHELSGMPAWAVSHALEHLPADFPPNVLQFKAACNQAQPPMRALIPAPRTRMSSRVRERLAELLRALRGHRVDPLAGARSLREKERKGFHLTQAQRLFWRAALQREEKRDDTTTDAAGEVDAGATAHGAARP